MPSRRALVLLAVLALAAAGVTAWLAPRLLPGLRPPRAAALPQLPSLAGLAWLQSPPLTRDSLAGHPVALLAFDDTDPAALAALPVLDAWYRAYAPYGARVLAVHAPQFAFAADPAVPARLARRLAPALPIALDPSLRVAQALGGVAGGPALVIADERGRVVLDTTGALAAGESALRAILARTRPDAVLPPAAGGAPLPAVRELRFSPGRIAAGPLAGAEPGRERMYAPVFRYQEEGRPETPYPVGEWRLDPDGLTATRGGAASFVAIRYSAARAGVVLSPPRDGAARVWVLRDGDWPSAAHRGEDVAAEGGAAVVEVREPRLYWVDQGGGMRTLRLSPDRPGVTLHALVLADAPR